MMKRIIIIAMFLLIMILPVAAFGILQGNIDNSEKIDLRDAILSLQISAGINVTVPVFTSADVNGDNKIGIAEAIYILQRISELRTGISGNPGVCVWDSSQWDNCLLGL